MTFRQLHSLPLRAPGGVSPPFPRPAAIRARGFQSPSPPKPGGARSNPGDSLKASLTRQLAGRLVRPVLFPWR